MAIATNGICEWVTWAIGFLWWIDSEFASLTPSFLPLHNQWQAECYSQILITLSMSSLLFLNTWPTCPLLFVSVHFVNDIILMQNQICVCLRSPDCEKRFSGNFGEIGPAANNFAFHGLKGSRNDSLIFKHFQGVNEIICSASHVLYPVQE